jgi:hypothetical protein
MKQIFTLKYSTIFFFCIAILGCTKTNIWEESLPKLAKKMLTADATQSIQAFIIPNVRSESANLKESQSVFICPLNTVVTGRYHSGDENGYTRYEYASLKAVDGQGQPLGGLITVENGRWENWFKESSAQGFTATAGRVIIGREHQGDENGSTRYYTGIIKFNGNLTTITDYALSYSIKESSGIYFKSGNTVITGRTHYGDENGNTIYQSGSVIYSSTTTIPGRFRVVVKLHPSEPDFPMNPLDFVRLSRFRMFISGGSDKGYNTNTNQFVTTNIKTPEYYNIPVNIINSYTIDAAGKNCRPRDANSGTSTYFLEPDDNLTGDFNPNGRVPAFQYALQDGRKQFWVFYGYNYSSAGISFSHQGDWENITLKIIDNSIEGCWLSQHENNPYYSKDQLQIVESGGIQTLYIYSAMGTHAYYPIVGDFGISNTDHAADGGYQWVITDNVLNLDAQPWRNYAGAWGEVGESSITTGPLGPWWKKISL